MNDIIIDAINLIAPKEGRAMATCGKIMKSKQVEIDTMGERSPRNDCCFGEFGTLAPLLPAAIGIDAFAEHPIAADIDVHPHLSVSRSAIGTANGKLRLNHFHLNLDIVDRINRGRAADGFDMPFDHFVDRRSGLFATLT